jgi:hypothetical protein
VEEVFGAAEEETSFYMDFEEWVLFEL